MLDIHATKTAAFVVEVDGDDFVFGDVNEPFTRNIRLVRERQVGKSPREFLPADLAETVLGHYRRCASTNAALSYETETVLSGEYWYWQTTLIPFASPETGKVTSLLGFCQDRTQEKIASLEADACREKLSLAIANVNGGFWIYEFATGRFETSRPLAELIAGPGSPTLDLAEYVNHIYAEDLNPELVLQPAVDLSTSDYRVVCFDRRTRWLRSTRRVVRDDKGAAVRMVGLVYDITEQKAALRSLETEASTDPLTSVKNRRAFERLAKQALRDAGEAGRTVGLLVIDLDGFKPINDRHGHRVGDDVLRKVARRIARHVRRPDTLARIGGDEFAICLQDTSAASMDALAMRIATAFRKPFDVDGHMIRVGLSIGGALSIAGRSTLAALTDHADRDLYAEKTRRRQLVA